MEVSENAALAAEVFDQFCSAGTLKSILYHHRHLCDLLHIRPTHFNQFYPKLKAKLRSWRAQALWNKFDKRASHKCYNRGKACTNMRVLVIGAGPCGLRSAIEAQLLGAKVVVVEKRDRITRNNVLHLWPFVIHDLKALGAKKFFGRFCAGAIDHISIRQLQCMLLKVALILGVEIHEGVGFESLIPPPPDQTQERVGWRANFDPADHPVAQYELNVLIGADGKRNTLDGFKRKEFRGKLAIAITANFINRHTEAEARVEEISGVAFIFNQKFFKELHASTGIDLENIVYYKDDTHYFVMTAKKLSLIDKGVIITDYSDTAKLLSAENVDKMALMEYAREAANFSTGYRLPQLEFAVNHYGQPDVAMFDFTSMYAAENASRFVERNGHTLLTALVGDSLLEPFWPTGSGCARGFLSSMDACWAMRSWATGLHPLEVLAERESIYRLLGQTTPENLQRDLQAYTLDPHTRYPNLNSRSVLPVQVRGLHETDDPHGVEEFLKTPKNAVVNSDLPKKRRRRDGTVHADTLLHWLQRQVALYDNVKVVDMTSSFKDGLALCAIIHRYRPYLLDFASLNREEVAENNQLAFNILERELAIPPVMTGEEMAECEVPDRLAMLSYLSQVYEAFRGEIPHTKHTKLDEADEPNAQITRIRTLAQMSPHQKLSLLGKLTTKAPKRRRSHNSGAPIQGSIEDRIKTLQDLQLTDRRMSDDLENILAKSSSSSPYAERIKELEREKKQRERRREEIERNRTDRYMRRKYLRHIANQQFYKSMQMLQSNARLVTEEESGPFEDYSLFVYRMTAPDFKDRVKELETKLLYPDRENKALDGCRAGGNNQEFSGRVKDFEAKLTGAPADKKPKDLFRAIGKIEKTDWNYKQIERKIEENRLGRPGGKKSEKVPKWSQEQFQDKYRAVEKKLMKDRKHSEEDKYSEFDATVKKLGRKVKEGISLEQGPRGANKVSAMAAHLATIHKEPEPAVVPTGKQPSLPSQGASELCHFCNKRVYLMERLSAEGRFFHRGCFRCQYCSTSLRLGNYAFDREGKYGSKFFCVQHFGFQGTARRGTNRDDSKPQVSASSVGKPPSTPVQNVETVDIGNTPERVEFENLSDCIEVEEDEFTDRNFVHSTTDVSDASQASDSSSDSDAYAEAEDGGLDPEETLRLVKNWTRKYAAYSPDSHDESETEMDEHNQRKKNREENESETGSETEVQSDDYSGDESSDEDDDDLEENSATEISTDSEFEHDGTTHPIPHIVISETVQVKRGHIEPPKPVQIVSKQQLTNGKPPERNILKLDLDNVELDPTVKNVLNNNNRAKPLINPNRGDYLLNRTRSTEGIASKISLELKKKFLFGTPGLAGNVKKSGSASTLDTKITSFIDHISEQQKLLNPAPVPSPTMQAFLQGAERLKTSPVQLQEKKTLPDEEFKHVCSLRGTEIEEKKDEEEERSRSPVHETSIVVPEFPRGETRDDGSDSLSSDLSTSEDDDNDNEEGEEEDRDRDSDDVEEEEGKEIGENNEKAPDDTIFQAPPKLEIHNSRGELMEDGPDLDSVNNAPKSQFEPPVIDFKKVITVPTSDAGSTVLTQVSNTAELFVNKEPEGRLSPEDSSDSLKNDCTAHTETEMSDWARDEDGMSEPLDDLEFIAPQYERKQSIPRGMPKIAKTEDFDDYSHVCGKDTNNSLNLDNLEFMDTGDESTDESSSRHKLNLNSGYVQFVNNEDDLTPVVETVANPLKEELTDTTTTSEPTTIKDCAVDIEPTEVQYDFVQLTPLEVPLSFEKVKDTFSSIQRKEMTSELKNNAVNSPATSRKLEQLSQERAKQKDLIHEMVMNKLLAQGKSPTERKRRSRNFSPGSRTTPSQPQPPSTPPPPTSPPVTTPNNISFPLSTPDADHQPRPHTPRQRSNTYVVGWKSLPHIRDTFSLPDIPSACHTVQKATKLRTGLKEQARAKFKMMTNEELGLSPEDKLKHFKLKIQKHLPETPKSSHVFDSDNTKKCKEDRKRSIIQAVSDFFLKKSPSPPKTPSSHSPSKSFNSNFSHEKHFEPPPVPPLPHSYTPSQEDSLSEGETHSGDNTSLIKKQRVSQMVARLAQSKRLRMAQEVQRQLEELEMKQKELEAQGVAVERALRGEDKGVTQSENELLDEWLRLMRERSEARSKEKMLVIRGQEIELEHRHARLQAQLSSLMTSSENKITNEEVALEGRILREMLEIAERKKSLQLQLQAETQRFQEEDRDIEAKLIAKRLEHKRKL